MNNTLSSNGRMGETRKHQRIDVPKGTFVIVSPGTDNEWKFPAIDISQCGVAFIYQGSKQDLNKSGVLNILTKNAHFENVKYATVSDESVLESTDTSLPLRRRGVKFEWMGVMEEADLRDFVKNNSKETD